MITTFSTAQPWNAKLVASFLGKAGVELEKDTKPPDLKKVRSMLWWWRYPKLHCLIAWKGSSPVAMAIYSFCAEPGPSMLGHYVYADLVFVNEDWRVNGVCRDMLTQLQHIARRKKCLWIDLHVDRLNQPARRAYEKFGAVEHPWWVQYRIPL